jgi:hypothetical protein
MNSTPDSFRPDGLPRLAAGAHVTPEDGACLMEYVSVLAGTTFSDHPRCTDPTLAALARLVNDACTDAGRSRLTDLVPALAATPAVDASGTAAIVYAALRAAHSAAGGSAALRRCLRRAERRRRRVAGAGPLTALARRLDVLHRRGPAPRRLEVAVAALARLPEPHRDTALYAVLEAAIAAASGPSATRGAQRTAGADLPLAGPPGVTV